MRFWLDLFGHIPDWHVALPAFLLALFLAWTVSEVTVAILRRLILGEGRDQQPHHVKAIRRALWVLRVVLVLILAGVFTPPVLELFGEPMRAGMRLGTLAHWIASNGVHVLLIITLAFIATRAIGLGTSRLERYFARRGTTPGHSHEHAKRARTLAELIRNVSTAAIVSITILMILEQLDVNVMPILTGAGILGLAVGFGAQTLVKDIISGFFLILENQVGVGDVAEINGTGGLVEAINLRTILLRDVRGAVHVFPCGSITTLANLTKDFSYALLDVQVHYKHDTDEVIQVLRDTADALQKENDWSAAILAPLEVLGIENLGDTGVTIRVRMKTVPLRQWDVTRELRRRIKKAFQEKDIDIPMNSAFALRPKA
jgi:small conductance mechanosensitive channel